MDVALYEINILLLFILCLFMILTFVVFSSGARMEAYYLWGLLLPRHHSRAQEVRSTWLEHQGGY